MPSEPGPGPPITVPHPRRIAILADIHGNLPALEAVLGDLVHQAVDEVLVGGDLVGRGPQGQAVVERIAALGWRGVRGNHEDYLLAFRRRTVPASWLDDESWSASRWMAAELDDFAEAYLDALPLRLDAALAPELTLVHGTPWSNNEGLGPWSSDAELTACLGAAPTGLLVCAHTHRAFVREVAGGRVVNVGSVGLPFNRDPRAQYALFEHSGEAGTPWAVQLRQVPYDLEAIFAVYDSSGFLNSGGVTSHLLRLELEHAVPFLVPFQRWAEVTRRPPRLSELDAFLAFYGPERSLRLFFERLASLV